MRYIKPSDKVTAIEGMSATTYQQLLNSGSKQDLLKGIIMAQYNVLTDNLEDKRIDTTAASRNLLSTTIGNDVNLQQKDLLLKTMSLSIIFANEKYLQQVADLSEEKIADLYSTDTNTVACKMLLDKKLASLHISIPEIRSEVQREIARNKQEAYDAYTKIK